MQTIELKKILTAQELNLDDVAAQLFPGNKHPRLALNRVMSGGAVLDADQISRLALITGLSISDLYSGNHWQMRSKDGVHSFHFGEYRAELDTITWITKVFHNDSLFHESIIHSGATPLSEYLKELDNVIDSYK